MWKYFISLFVWMSYSATAQVADSTRSKFAPSGVRIGTDLITLIQGQTSNKFTGWEATADVDFYRYYFTVEYGTWQRSLNIKNGDYQNDGSYWRAGIDVNFLLKDPDRNMFFLGFRYAGSTFNESLSYSFTDANYGLINNQLINTNRTARWGELVTGLRVKIWKELWMGYTGRMKFASGQRGEKQFDTYEIPGFGTLAKDIYWGFNYQIYWRFAWRKNLGPTRVEK